MTRSAFASTETATIELEDLGWIEVKGGLTFAEQSRLQGAAMRAKVGGDAGGGDGTAIDLDWERYQLAKLEVWLADWGLEDGQGKSIPLSKAAIANLAPDVAKLISDAIDARVATVAEGKAIAAPNGAAI